MTDVHHHDPAVDHDVAPELAPVHDAAGERGDDDAPPLREVKLLEGIAGLAADARSSIDGERALFLLGAFLAPLGFLLVLVGWYGAAGQGLVFEQMPYLISGGLGGLGLMVVGAALYTGWWQTRRIRQAADHHAELLAAHAELAERVAELAAVVGALDPDAARSGNGRRRAPLRAAPGD